MKVIIAICLILLGCRTKEPANDFNTSLQLSLEYLVKNIKLPDEYKNQPLQIINFESPKIKSPLEVNGKNCIILPEKTNVNELLKGMNLFKPIPIVEIIQYKTDKHFIDFDIILRSTGHAFKIKLARDYHNNFKVVKIDESTI